MAENVPNRAQDARRKVESSILNESMGKFRTGPIKSKAEKRNVTRTDKKRNAIKEEMD
jgi:hypothetical protein